MTDELQKKVERAVRLIQSAGSDGSVVEVAYSGGKDSDVILELTRMAGIKYRAIYKNTSIDPPGTIKHAQEQGAEIIRPKKTFFQLMEEQGIPNRFQRYKCCGILKEYKVLDRSIQGIRKCESTDRNRTTRNRLSAVYTDVVRRNRVWKRSIRFLTGPTTTWWSLSPIAA